MNPLRGEAALAAGDETYTLVFDANAFCAMEAVLDQDTDTFVAAAIKQMAGKGVNLTLWRGLLWGALQQRHPCTIAQAGDILGAAGIVAIKAVVMRALRETFGLQAAEGGDTSDPPLMGDAGTG